MHRITFCNFNFFQAWKILSEEGTGPTRSMILMIDFMAFLFAFTMIVSAIYKSHIVAIVAGKRNLAW